MRSIVSLAEPYEEFQWNGIIIRQKKDVFKIGTDALLLGAWIPTVSHHPSRILDVGTGTGILALMMAYYFPQSGIVALDDDERAISLANYNFQNSSWPERLFARKESILGLPATEEARFDLIVSNPPFYFDQLRAKTTVKSVAKHAYSICSEWLEALSVRLNTNGQICIILPSSLAFEWIENANVIGLYCHQRLDVYSMKGDQQPIRSLLALHSSLTEPVLNQIYIHEKRDVYTGEYLQLTGLEKKVR